MNPIFLQKDHPDLPDIFTVKIYYVTGKVEEYEIASHYLVHQTKTYEFVTKDDLWHWVPLAGVLRFEFDKRWSKIVAIKQKQAKEKEESAKLEKGIA